MHGVRPNKARDAKTSVSLLRMDIGRWLRRVSVAILVPVRWAEPFAPWKNCGRLPRKSLHESMTMIFNHMMVTNHKGPSVCLVTCFRLPCVICLENSAGYELKGYVSIENLSNLYWYDLSHIKFSHRSLAVVPHGRCIFTCSSQHFTTRHPANSAACIANKPFLRLSHLRLTLARCQLLKWKVFLNSEGIILHNSNSLSITSCLKCSKISSIFMQCNSSRVSTPSSPFGAWSRPCKTKCSLLQKAKLSGHKARSPHQQNDIPSFVFLPSPRILCS